MEAAPTNISAEASKFRNSNLLEDAGTKQIPPGMDDDCTSTKTTEKDWKTRVMAIHLGQISQHLQPISSCQSNPSISHSQTIDPISGTPAPVQSFVAPEVPGAN